MDFLNFRLPQQKARKELCENIIDPSNMAYEQLKKLTFIDYIQQKTIRMAGPAATCFIRVAKDDMFVGNIPLSKDTGVFIEPTANHYNQTYFEKPHQFRPQRWGQATKCNPLAFAGFFGGPRTCLGKHLSLLQSKITLAKILIRYSNFEIQEGSERMQMKFLYGPEKFTIRALIK